MKYNPTKVIKEIELLRNRILSDGEDFSKLHKDIIRFCEEMGVKEKIIKEIKIEPEEIIQIVLTSPDGQKEEMKIPSDENILEMKNNLTKEILNILDEIEKKYLLKQRLMD